MTTQIKITQLADIGSANIAVNTLLPVVNMAGVSTTQKTTLGNLANVVLSQTGGNYVPAALATIAYSVANAAQPNITSVGTLTDLEVANSITANGTAYLGNVSTTGVATITTLVVGSTADLGSVNNIIIEGGTNGQVLSTDGDGNLSWATVSGGGGNTGDIGFDNNVIYSNIGVVINNSDLTNGQTAGMSIPIQGDGNSVSLYNTYGNVTLLAGNIGNSQNVQTWSFGADGNMNIPGAIVGNGNLNLQPDFTNAGAYLDVFLSSGPDVHLVASQSANLILGKDNQSNVMTSWDGNVYIQSWDNNTNTQGGVWSFGGDGNLTLPGNTSSINYANGNPYGGGGSANTGNITFDGTTISGPSGSSDNYSVYIKPSGDFINALQIYPTADNDIHLFETTGNAITLGSYGESQVSVSGPNSPNANIIIQSNGNIWEFGDGVLQVPSNASQPGPGTIASANGYPTLLAYGNSGGFGIHGGPELDWMNANDPANNFSNNTVLRNTMFINGGGLYIGMNENGVANVPTAVWRFNPDGTTIFPTLDTQRGDNPSGTIQGQTLLFGDDSQEAIISTPDGTSNINSSQRLVINPGEGFDGGEGGDIYLWAGRGGPTNGSGGDVKIRGGQGMADGTGGYIRIEGGDSQANGYPGYIDITGGYGGNAEGGYVHLTGGTGATSGGPAVVTGGYGSNIGGDANIVGGYGGTNQGGNINITAGSSALGLPGYGNVNIGAGASTWKFNNDGNLVLPADAFNVKYANGQLVQLGSSGNISQISNGNSNVSVPTSNDNVYITTNNGSSKQWIFDTTGNLRAPGNIDIYGAINFPQQVSSINWSTYNIELSQYGRITTNVDFFANANTIGAQYLKGDGSNITNISVAKIANGASNVNIPTSNGNVVISANGTANWTLDTTGNLTIPGGGAVWTLGTGTSGLTANFADPYKVNLGLDYTTNIATLAGSNAVAITANTGINTKQWTFDTNGNLTIPGGLIGSGASPAPYISGFDSISSITLSASGNITGGNIIGNGGTLSNVAVKTSGSWTLASGVNTVNISVPLNGTYAIWVNGNIPNGIITYTATAVITNTNVPVLGSQYAWYYAVGNALVFTSIPDQFVGTVGSISNVNTYAGNTANVFTFGITNNSGNTAVVNYGYTKL
jgi:hypothetical protein